MCTQADFSSMYGLTLFTLASTYFHQFVYSEIINFHEHKFGYVPSENIKLI